MRAAVLLAVLALALAAPAAHGQSDAFGPLPEAAPTATPTPEPADEPAGDDGVGRTTLYAIGGGLLIFFAGLAIWITRDARRSLPAESRAAPATLREDREHKHERPAKAHARKRARAARAARKRNR